MLAFVGAALLAQPALAQQRALEVASGNFKLVTYNVAGLPEGISSSTPSVNMPLISKLLNRYDVALVQEDFAYGRELRSAALHPFSTPAFERDGKVHLGDGLSQFSRMPFSGHVRQAWADCNGIIDAFFDCLTPKGFTFARLLLAPGVSVDVYNVHLDAGDATGDLHARTSQLAQLTAAVERWSSERPLIIAGDTNLSKRESSALAAFLKRLGLKDACAVKRCERWQLDRVLFRSGGGLDLAARNYALDNRFVDSRGRPLSDHAPVAVEFRWAVQAATASLEPQPKRGATHRAKRPAGG